LSSSPPISDSPFRVAILGRPNVGKSTLFNRLLGRRRAITHASPGVTRDAVEEELRLEGLRCLLTDSGGYTLEQGPIQSKVAARSSLLAESSDLLLLTVEVGGLTGEDLDFLEKLRRFQHKLILVVNKVDGEKQELELGDFYALGVPRLVAVSAAHGRNFESLKRMILAAAREKPLAAGAPEAGVAEGVGTISVAILGKPNTGKSTLLNRLLQREHALVTELPGTTRDPVAGRFLYRKHSLRVIDTAGIRRKSKVTDAVEYYSVNRAIQSIGEADIVTLLLDAAEGLSEQDKKIAALAARAGRGLILCLNKWDTIAGGSGPAAAPARAGAAGRRGTAARQRGRAQTAGPWPGLRDRTRFKFPTVEFAPLLPISALTGWGVPQLLDTILAVWRQLNRRVTTHRLNRALRSWLLDYPLPVRGRNVKIRYGTQTGTNPVRFLFFVNDRKGYPDRYSRYLVNRIREEFGFGKVPVLVDVRES
jgi:GTP-binding protein